MQRQIRPVRFVVVFLCLSMPLPIVLGGKSVSAQTLPGTCGRPDESEDGDPLEPLALYQTLGWGICPKREWLVRVTCNYYDLIHPDNGHRECTMVEVRIQLSPFTRPFSPDYRETAHHLRLFDGAQDKYPQTQPQVVVSSDRRNLAVLLFHPHQQSSALVFFQLRKPRSDLSAANATNPIPLPSYIQKIGNEDSNATSTVTRDPPAVATHPRFVSVWGICTICSIPNVSPSVFLAACQDASLVWLDARSSMAVASGMIATDEADMLPLTSLTIAPYSTMKQGDFLAVTANGKVLLSKWKAEAKSKVQQTILKRASTGKVITEVLEGPTQQLRRLAEKQKRRSEEKAKQEHSTPSRSKSDQQLPIQGQLQAFLSPMLNRQPSSGSTASHGTNPLQNFDIKLPFSTPKRTKSQQVPKKSQQLDEFVINELQNNPQGGDVHSPINQKLASGQHRRRKSDVAALSRPNGGSANDSLRQNMHVEVLSVTGGEANGDFAVDAVFTNLPTVICVLYSTDVLKRQVAEVLGVGETGALTSLVSLTLSKEQIEQAFKVHSSVGDDSENDSTKHSVSASQMSRVGVDFDPSTETFAISTLTEQGNVWIGCLWNWRSNVLGWTIQNRISDFTLWSRLYFANHSQQGSHIAFLETHQDKYLRTRKQVIATGILSPSCSGTTSIEPAALLLTNESIRFPDAYQQSHEDTLELDWRISSLPVSYINSYGPPRIAASGRQNGNSIAVASSCGVCVFDRLTKWKQFGTPSEERSFQVMAMSWWEGGDSLNGETEAKDDFLMAIIQSHNGRQYLSCWSPKRLDLAHQLLQPPNYNPTKNDDGSLQFSWGVALRKDIKATSLSLLSETTNSHGSRRAVALVSSSNTNTCDLSYQIFQIEVLSRSRDDSSGADTYRDLQPFSIVAKKRLEGTLKNGARSIGPVSSSFLAAASFDFDDSATAEGDSTEDDLVATIGVVRTPGGLESVSLYTNNSSYVTDVIKEGEIAKLSLADTICDSQLNSPPDDASPVDAFVWTLETIDGKIYCWTVPYRIKRDGEELQMTVFLKETTLSHPKGLNPPTLACRKETRNPRRRLQSGVICHVGNSTDWMQQSSSGTQTDVSLGQIPESAFGCILRAGQHARKLHRSGVGDFDTELFANDFLATDVFGPSNFLMMPPAFVPSIYTLLLEAAYLRTEIPILEDLDSTSVEMKGEKNRLKAIERHVCYRIKASSNMDAVLMGLRLLILRAAEMLSSVDKKHRKHETDVSKSNLMLSLALFTEIVEVVRQCTSNLQFASFFLEVGRQIEPSCLPYLFPLPKSRKTTTAGQAHPSRTDRFRSRSVMELFTLCIQEGALAASASALPLLNSRNQSRQYCHLLLSKAMKTFICNMRESEIEFDVSQEDRRVIGDIFRFGIKLEDAALYEVQAGRNGSGRFQEGGLFGELVQSDDDLVAALSLGSASGDTVTTTESENYIRSTHRSLICVGGGIRRSSILDYVIPSIFASQKDTGTEDAIRKAASSFIETKTDLASQDFLNLSHETEEEEEVRELNLSLSTHLEEDHLGGEDYEADLTEPKDIPTVAFLVTRSLVELLQAPSTDQPWKTMAGLSRLILQQSTDYPGVATFAMAVDVTTLEELRKVLPYGYNQEDSLLRFLVTEIGHCEFQIGRAEASWIVDLVLVLLERYQETELLPSSSATASSSHGLILIGLIAGHRSDKAMDLLGHCTERLELLEVYQRVQEACQSRV